MGLDVRIVVTFRLYWSPWKKEEILKNVRYNLNFKPKINEDRISPDQTLVYTCSLKII